MGNAVNYRLGIKEYKGKKYDLSKLSDVLALRQAAGIKVPIYNDIAGSRRIPLQNKYTGEILWIYLDRGEVGSGFTGFHFNKADIPALFKYTPERTRAAWGNLGKYILGKTLVPFMEGVTPLMFTWGAIGGPTFSKNLYQSSKNDRLTPEVILYFK